MYYLLGFESNLGNMVAFSKNHNKSISNSTTLKKAYINQIRELQPEIQFNRERSLDVYKNGRAHILENETHVVNLSRFFIDSYSRNDLYVEEDKITQSSTNSKIEKQNAIEQALEYIKEKDNNIYQLFILAINGIFIADGTNGLEGGSLSSALGLIWSVPNLHWNIYDNVEFLIHELTHNLVFIDELNHGYFYNFDSINTPENYAFSPITQKMRPLDKVIHAIAVASEIIDARDKLAINSSDYAHQDSNILKSNIVKSLKSIEILKRKQSRLFHERFHELVSLYSDKYA